MDSNGLKNPACFICLAPASNKCDLCPDEVYYCCQEHYKLHRSINNGEKQCNPFVIKYVEGVGRYMVANRDINPGETIFEDTVTAVGPADSSCLCLNCNAKIVDGEYTRCGVCEFPMCGKECIEGSEHLKICAYLKGKGSAVVDVTAPNSIYDAILPLKLLLMKESEPQRFSLLDNLMDHKSERFAYPEYFKSIKENVTDVIMDIKGLSVDEEDILHIVGIIDTNSHEINNRNGSNTRGVFPLGAILSHRCVVNSRQIMVKEAPFPNTCRSTVFIPKGQEIFTTYIWPHLSTRRRRKSLSDGWHFACECFRCSDPSELGALTSAILCKLCPKGYLLHENPLEQGLEQWKCHQCGEMGDSKHISTMVQNLTEEVESLGRDDLESNLSLLQKCREFLHCNHSLLTELRVRVIPIITRQPGMMTLNDYPESVITFKRQLCRENLQVLNIITPGLSHQRGGVLFELQECNFFLAKRKLECGLITEKEFVDALKDCKKLLLECGQCLTNERPKSIEEFYEKSAMVSLKAVIEYIVTFSS